jgi:hypothetical protein
MYPGMSHMGDVKQVTAHHLADGQPLALELQVGVCWTSAGQQTYRPYKCRFRCEVLLQSDH